jgi:hypothetical protein
MGLFNKLDMKILQRFFGQKKPVLSKNDIPDFNKVSEFVSWFLNNDSAGDHISYKRNNIIFNEGHWPKTGTANNPESFTRDINSLKDWFLIKVFLDLNLVKDSSKDEFKTFINFILEPSFESLTLCKEIAPKYNFVFENSKYETEIVKIPSGFERDNFKFHLLNSSVILVEIKILTRLYHDYFNE